MGQSINVREASGLGYVRVKHFRELASHYECDRHDSGCFRVWMCLLNCLVSVPNLFSCSPELSDAVDQMINRLRIPNPNVQLQTVKLLSSCVSNCGRPFRVALCSQAFASELRRLLLPNRGNRTHQKVQDELKKAAIEWRGNFAGDPQLHIIDTTLTDLQRSGMSLDVSSSGGDGPSSSKAAEERRQREKEEEELAMAMALSQSEVSVHQHQVLVLASHHFQCRRKRTRIRVAPRHRHHLRQKSARQSASTTLKQPKTTNCPFKLGTSLLLQMTLIQTGGVGQASLDLMGGSAAATIRYSL